MEEEYCSGGMLDSYLYESFELLEELEEIVLSESNIGFLDRESINEIFRILHTLKGSSGIMMYDSITRVSHKLEDIFYYLRESASEDIPKAEISKYIFPTVDFISRELNKIKDGRIPDGNPRDIEKAIDTYLTALKTEIQEKGMMLPPENVYVEPNQYYIAPAAESDGIIRIDLDAEPMPGDYVIEKQKNERENLVGVSVKKLDKLTLLVDKLLLLEENAAEKQRKVTREIRDTVSEMRQAPIGEMFRKMNRVVFDASRKLAKDIELEMEGENILVDRIYLEQLSAPLMHMVRNAVDHGIESAGKRLSVGKTAKGIIILKARKEKDILYISVEDDGRGLDKYKIFEKAKLSRLVDSDEDISKFNDAEIYRYITMAGFSTKDSVTDISGRGVGMDVVADKMKELGGSLHIESTFGVGTLMTMEISLNYLF